MLLEEGVRVYKYSLEENVMAIVLEPKTSYNLISREESNNNKLLIHVKLTDSCLRALEDYETTEVSSRRRPSIKFSGFHGVISIPLRKSRSENDNRAEFQLNCSAIESDGRQGCMDCVQQPGDSKDIRTVGTITHKINVKATDDSYQMTQQRMKEAEEERKGIRTKVINTPSKGNKGVTKNVLLSRPRNSIMAAVKRKMKSGPPGAKVSNGPSKSVRERVIHLLAVRPYKKPELISRLNKDGVNLRDRNALTGILQQVSVTTDNQYRLLKHLYSEVQVDTWPGYTETERQLLRRTINSHLNDNCLVTSSSSPPKNTISVENIQTNKRSSSSKPLQSSKRQRVAHVNKNNNIVCDSVETSSNDNPVDSTEKNADADDLKEDSPLSTVESTTTEHSINGENGVDTPEFMSKYKPITSYEQRAAYKRDFQKEYEEYKLLKELIDTVSTEFTALDEKRQQYAVESVERKAIEDKILELYKEKQKDSLWQERKKKCHDLHTKLSYIKQLITNYDKSTVHT